MQQVHNGIEKTFTDVKSAMEASNIAQVNAISAVLDSHASGVCDRAELESAKADLESALIAL